MIKNGRVEAKQVLDWNKSYLFLVPKRLFYGRVKKVFDKKDQLIVIYL
jgi:hypothetical protein